MGLTTRSFEARGWDVDNCGTLLARRLSDPAGFRAACEAATRHRVTVAALWLVAGCAAVLAYGYWLRRSRGVRAAAPIS